MIAAEYPTETVAQRVDRILSSTSPLTSLSGKCVTGGMLNLYDALMYTGSPEINVRLGSIQLPDGSVKNAGVKPASKIVGRTFTFTIENLGLVPLNLTGSPDKVYLTGPNAKHFSITMQPTSPVNGSSSTTFKFKTKVDSLPPGLPVGKEYPISVTINIPNDDADENPYTFTLNFTLKVD